MGYLIGKLTDWVKDMLVGGIMSNLSGLFNGVNDKVSEVSGMVGASPQAWNGQIFNMVKNLSENVIVPIAGVILTFVMTYELIQMVIDKNSFHDFETFTIFKWIFKTFCAVLLVTNTWNIIMGVFEMAQTVVNRSAGLIAAETDMDIMNVIRNIETRLRAMDVGPLLGLWFQTLLVSILSWILSICVFIIVYGRMLEVYLLASLGPIPLATMANREWGSMGQNYIRSLLAIAFQAFLIIVCVAIYAILIHTISAESDIIAAIWTCIGYTVLLCFSLFKTSSLSKAVFSAH